MYHRFYRICAACLLGLIAQFVLAQDLVDEGSPDAPIVVHADRLYQGQVGEGISYYRVDVLPDTLYPIRLSGTDGDADMRGFGSDSAYEEVVHEAFGSSLESESLITSSDGSTLYFLVDGSYTGGGSGFQMTIEELGMEFASEGTQSTPVRVPVGEAYAGQVTTGFSYYVAASKSGQVYSVRISDLLDDADLEVYLAQGTEETAGQSMQGGTEDDEAFVTATGSNIFIMLDGNLTSAGTSFTLEVTERGEGYRPEGRVVIQPLEISLGVHHGHVDTTASYYRVAVATGKRYEVVLSELESDADLYLYDDPDYIREAASSSSGGTETDRASITSSSDWIYIKVEGANTDFGSVYQLDVRETRAAANEGTQSSPVSLTAGESHEGQVASGGLSHYRIATIAGGRYVLILSEMTDDADLYVYSDPGYSRLAGSSANGGTDEELLRLQAEGSALYVTVDGTFTEEGTQLRLEALATTSQ